MDGAVDGEACRIDGEGRVITTLPARSTFTSEDAVISSNIMP
jgi:hypothetical protein